MSCSCDYEVYGAHSGACYDEQVRVQTREMNARIDAKLRAEKRELEQLRRRLAAVRAVLEDRRFDDWWMENVIAPDFDAALATE